MARPHSVERTIDLAVVGDALPTIIEDAARAGERLVVAKDGVSLAVHVPASAAPAADRDARMDELFAALERIGAAFADVALDELEREVDRAVREVRAERRARMLRDADG